MTAASHPAARVAAGALILALLAAAIAIDASADAAFDAPKRLAVAVAVAVTALALAFVPTGDARGAWPASARWACGAGGVLVACVAIATLRADAPTVALDASRWMVLMGAVVVIGASPLLHRPTGTWIAVAATVGVVGNALMSWSQWLGFGPDFTVAGSGGRFDTGAMLGNEGYVALACALLGAAAAAVARAAPTRRVRVGAWAAVVLAVATMLVNQQRTSLLAWGLAFGVVLLARHRPRVLRVLGITAATMFCAGVVAVATWSRPTQGPAVFDDERLAQLQQVTTYRLSAWAAAIHMIEQRPWFGHGPASFAQRSQPHRQAVESAWRQRLDLPPNATLFTQAHQEYLQLAAECGLPALLALVVALVALGLGLLGVLIRGEGPPPLRCEALVLLALLAAGSVSALAWFPLQIPLTGLILLLAAGRAWRLIIDAEGEP